MGSPSPKSDPAYPRQLVSAEHDPADLILEVWLRCPLCRYGWHAATIDTESWWGTGLTPTKIAQLCYCPKCHAGPPMWRIVKHDAKG